MVPPRPKIALGSWLHRKLRLKPGDVPCWLCSSHQCGGFDLLIPLHLLLLAGLVFVPVLISKVSWLWIPGLVLFCLFVGSVSMPFADRERWGRARRRRGECVWCGQPEVAAGVECPSCGRE